MLEVLDHPVEKLPFLKLALLCLITSLRYVTIFPQKGIKRWSKAGTMVICDNNFNKTKLPQ